MDPPHLAPALCLLLLGPVAAAQPLFSDSFDAEPVPQPIQGVTTLSNWSVSGGVDLAPHTFPDQSLYARFYRVSGVPASLTSNAVFGPGVYSLSFRLAGGEVDDALLAVRTGEASFYFAAMRDQPFAARSTLFEITQPGGSALTLSLDAGEALRVDDIVVLPAPAPAAPALFALAALSFARRPARSLRQ